jgi:hypothetical protein
MRARRLMTTVAATVLTLAVVGCEPVETTGSKSKGKGTGGTTTTTATTSRAQVKITSAKGVCWKGKVGRTAKSGCGSTTVVVKADNGTYRVQIRKTKGQGRLTVALVIAGSTVDHAQVSGTSGVVALSYDNG